MNPLEISDQSMAVFVKNTQKGKRMSKLPGEDEIL